MAEFNIDVNTPAYEFWLSRHKVQLVAGGFGAGKTALVVVKALLIAREYPGARILVARATRPKLRTSIQDELFKWLPDEWQKSFNDQQGKLRLTNGTVIEFNYVKQQGSASNQRQSNLLSASYDLIVFDQLEDPEMSHKDFLDMMGRLRGQTDYRGDDMSMPSTGPRWILATANPARNWLYHKIVSPLLKYRQGVDHPDLMRDRETGEPIVHLVQVTTYDNAHNLAADYIRGLESAYSGQMAHRYLYGGWGAYEGLVYPDFDMATHVLPFSYVSSIIDSFTMNGRLLHCYEAYDHGIAVPSCYLMAFVDPNGNIIVFDGVYRSGGHVESLAASITEKRRRYDMQYTMPYADPAIFRRASSGGREGTTTVANLFQQHGLFMQRGNNDILGGIEKVNGYLVPKAEWQHPLYNMQEAPALYFTDNLTWLIDEISDYRWKQNSTGDYVDEPVDGNDHAMDTLRYLLTPRPTFQSMLRRQQEENNKYAQLMQWTEQPETTDHRKHRYV